MNEHSKTEENPLQEGHTKWGKMDNVKDVFDK
jgi:hypothetical protein